MKTQYILSLVLCLIVNQLFAQNVEFGTWRTHLPFLIAKTLDSTQDKFVCGTETGLFYLNKSDFSLERFTKNEGLTQNDIVAVGVHPTQNITVVAYSNLNIDVVENNTVRNVPAIKNSSILGVKSINQIYVEDNLAYICGSFGIAILDIRNYVILETYSLTDGTTQVIVNDIAFDAQNIYAATNF